MRHMSADWLNLCVLGGNDWSVTGDWSDEVHVESYWLFYGEVG